MGLGLFGTPLYLNEKCLVFSAMLIAIYWMPPWRTFKTPGDLALARFISIGLAFVGYILMAWYDVLYDANDRLRPTFLGWMSKPFKPAYYGQEYEELPLKWKKTVRAVDIVFMIAAVTFILAPFALAR